MMYINNVLACLDPIAVINLQAAKVRHICVDTREEIPLNSLFVALSGNQADGHQYIATAIKAGCIAVLCETLPNELLSNITYIQVANTRQSLGILAHHFYGKPSEKIQVIAVTGTSGKSSTVHLLYHTFCQMGYCVGMLSTIYHAINGKIFPSTHTTPDALLINHMLAKMLQQGCQYCFMEVSSHAIVQHRITGIYISGAIFMNITHEHLDYHGTFAAYIQAKKALFDLLPKGAFALYNADDQNGKIMVQNTKASAYSFAMKNPADFMAKLTAMDWNGIEMRIANHKVWLQLLGSFNAYNALATYAASMCLAQNSQSVLIALSTIRPIVGRLQHVHCKIRNIDFLVDYAHKPDALEKVLLTIQQIRKQRNALGKLITIIGCGGNRDTQKRPLMAKIAFNNSDLVIFTSDNPRNECPKEIIADMQKGLTAIERMQTKVIVDRGMAIKTAYQIAQPHDTILIAGKGHEVYQEIAGNKIPFSDIQLVNDMIKSFENQENVSHGI